MSSYSGRGSWIMPTPATTAGFHRMLGSISYSPAVPLAYTISGPYRAVPGSCNARDGCIEAVGTTISSGRRAHTRLLGLSHRISCLHAPAYLTVTVAREVEMGIVATDQRRHDCGECQSPDARALKHSASMATAI